MYPCVAVDLIDPLAIMHDTFKCMGAVSEADMSACSVEYLWTAVNKDVKGDSEVV